MEFKRIITVLAFVGLTFSGAGIAAAEDKEEAQLTRVVTLIVPMSPGASYSPALTRPAALPALYVSLGAMQVFDVYSTRSALKAGAREANAIAAPFSGNAGSMLGLKAATTVGTIVFAERLWKKNKVGAIVMLAAINGATAAVSIHNMRNAKMAAGR